LGLINGSINALRDLEDPEYQEFEKAAEVLWRYSKEYQVYVILVFNYFALRKVLEKYASEYTDLNRAPLVEISVEINRCLLNWLSSLRTFLDHSEFNLKKRYGHNSDEVKLFESACARAYDNHFSYRFTYRLRNYAQHCGLPLGTLSLGSKLDQQTGATTSYFRVCFNRDELLKKFKDWGPVEEDLKGQPETFEINPHIDETMQQLSEIQDSVLSNQLSELMSMVKRIDKLIQPTRGMQGTPCILIPKDDPVNPKMKHVRIEWIPLHVMEILENHPKSNAP
jgi:hypothetical protein